LDHIASAASEICQTGRSYELEQALRVGLDGWMYREPPASPEAVQSLSAGAPPGLPDEYFELLRFSNGGGGELGVEPGWFQLWRAEDMLEFNQKSGLTEFLPGFFGFGSNGGGEILALDLRAGPTCQVVMVTATGLDLDDVVTIADTFSEFLEALGRVCPD
jgi:hypothetical protein